MSHPCSTCKHLFVVNKNDRWYRWLCMDVPLRAWQNDVTGETVADPPYMPCKERRGIHKGKDCPAWEAGINSLSPDKFIPMERVMEGERK